MNCYLCTCSISPPNDSVKVTLTKIFKRLECEASSENKNFVLEKWCCLKCSKVSNDVVSLIKKIERLQIELQLKLEQFGDLIKLDSDNDSINYEEKFKKRAKEKSIKLLQPTVRLTRLDKNLIEALEENRQQIILSECNETTLLCSQCRRKKYPPLFSTKEQLNRHEWSHHYIEKFRHIKPYGLSSTDYCWCVREFMENEVNNHLNWVAEEKFEVYYCLYCTDSKLDSIGGKKTEKRYYLDQNTIYHHIGNEHLNEITDHLKVSLHYKLKQSKGEISEDERKNIEESRFRSKRQHKPWSETLMEYENRLKNIPSRGGARRRVLLDFASAWWKKKRGEEANMSSEATKIDKTKQSGKKSSDNSVDRQNNYVMNKCKLILGKNNKNKCKKLMYKLSGWRNRLVNKRAKIAYQRALKWRKFNNFNENEEERKTDLKLKTDVDQTTEKIGSVKHEKPPDDYFESTEVFPNLYNPSKQERV